MFFIEVILTIVVWRRGWKWLSLIPMGSTLGVSLLLGMGMGASGGTMTDEIVGFSFILEIISVIGLIVMATVGKKG